MIEVIIFYSYIFVEATLALIIFAIMYCEHKRRAEEERQLAEEAAAEMEKMNSNYQPQSSKMVEDFYKKQLQEKIEEKEKEEMRASKKTRGSQGQKFFK